MICWGVRRRGRRLVCGEEVRDPKVIEETLGLISEFLMRVKKHKDMLLNDVNTPFDDSIKALSGWMSSVVVVTERDKVIAESKHAGHEAGKAMVKLLSQARERWFRTYKPELEELIGKLQSGEAMIIITGDSFDKNKSFTAHLYMEHIAIEVERVAKSRSITMNIKLTGLKGVSVIVSKLLSGNRLRAMQYGLLLTDGSIHDDGYPEMTTNHIWQAITFSLIFPGKVYMNIEGVSLSDDYVSITWRLRAINYKGKFESKAKIAEKMNKLNNKEFMGFLLLATLCDGLTDIEMKRIMLFIGNLKHNLWSGIVERLVSYGFREGDGGYRKIYTVWKSKAVAVAKSMLSNPKIRALIEDLSQLPDAGKLRRLLMLSNMEIKPRGNSSVEVIKGLKMNIHVKPNGYIELRIKRKGYDNARSIWERLRKADYNAKLRQLSDRFFEVYITQIWFIDHPKLIIKICRVLRNMYEEAIGKSNAKRASVMAQVMTRLGCKDPAQTHGPK
ncbi:hypothetical protein [Caldivirga sp.]|uniref:hypothetical protein n=1 Tax=Caldivirga sp. TaxID=2080243 RepID=UPI003D11D4BC